MKKNKLKILVKVFFVLLVLTLGIYVVKTIIECITTYNDIATSFPWYTPIVINGMIFAIPFILELVLFIYFHIRSKR